MHVEVDPLLPSGIMQADFALIIGGKSFCGTEIGRKRLCLAILHSPMNICLMFIFMLTCYTLEVP